MRLIAALTGEPKSINDKTLTEEKRFFARCDQGIYRRIVAHPTIGAVAADVASDRHSVRGSRSPTCTPIVRPAKFAVSVDSKSHPLDCGKPKILQMERWISADQ